MGIEELENSKKIVDYFLKNIEKLGKLSGLEGRDILQLASYTAKNCEDIILKVNCLNLLYSCCFYLKEIDLKEIWNIYWILKSSAFTDSRVKLAGNLDELYRFVYEKVRESVSDTYERTDNSGSNIVVVITNQFLSAAHAPTRRVLDYSYTIATALGKQIVIINDASFHFYPCACLEQSLYPNYVNEYSNMKEVTYKGLKIPFMQFSGYMPDLYGIKEMLWKIYQLQPELVYNINDSCLVSDLCGKFTKTVCMPCSNSMPITMGEYLLVGRNLEDSDEERLTRLEPYQKVIETITNYELPESTREYERSSFGIQEDSFVIGIIGNRLDKEISDDFILIMKKILEQQDIHFMIIGNIAGKARIEEIIPKVENLHFTGALQEASQAIKLCNIYCNPKRSGGGRSSFEALAHGVPVITLKYGDVYYTCGNEFAVDTYDDYLERINHYMTDKAYYQTAREKALKQAKILSDLPGTQKKIFEKIYNKTL